MPVNWSDPSEVSQFRAAALQQGFDMGEVDSEIQRNTKTSSVTPSVPKIEAPNPMVLPEIKTSPVPQIPVPTPRTDLLTPPPVQRPQEQSQPEQKQYDPTGKTPEQVLAETGRQSTLDQLGGTVKMPEPTPSMSSFSNQTGGVPAPSTPTSPTPSVAPVEGTQGTILGSKGRLGTAAGVRQGADVFSGGINNGRDVAIEVGVPLAAPQGTWIVEKAYGDDTRKGYIGNGSNSGYGNSVLLRNADTGEKIRMSHLSAGLGVEQGQKIDGGTIIGKTGLTGNTSGPHLDIEYYDEQGRIKDIMRSPYGAYLM